MIQESRVFLDENQTAGLNHSSILERNLLLVVLVLGQLAFLSLEISRKIKWDRLRDETTYALLHRIKESQTKIRWQYYLNMLSTNVTSFIIVINISVLSNHHHFSNYVLKGNKSSRGDKFTMTIMKTCSHKYFWYVLSFFVVFFFFFWLAP